jgi:hypothetical protein
VTPAATGFTVSPIISSLWVIFLPRLALLAHPETSRPPAMAKLNTAIDQAIRRQLRSMYFDVVAEGVPARLVAILTELPNADPAALAARSPVT